MEETLVDFPRQLTPVHGVDLSGDPRRTRYTGRVGWPSTSTLDAWNSMHINEARGKETELKITSYVKFCSTFFGG